MKVPIVEHCQHCDRYSGDPTSPSYNPAYPSGHPACIIVGYEEVPDPGRQEGGDCSTTIQAESPST